MASDDTNKSVESLAGAWSGTVVKQALLEKQKELGLVDKNFVLKTLPDGSVDPSSEMDWSFELVKSVDEMTRQVLRML